MNGHAQVKSNKKLTEKDFENLHEMIQDFEAESAPFDLQRNMEIAAIENDFAKAKQLDPKAVKPPYPRVDYRHMRIQNEIQIAKQRLGKALLEKIEQELDSALDGKTFEEAAKHVAEKEAKKTPAPQE